MKKQDFSGKKIAVLGLGMEGQDLCQFLLKEKAKLTVFDQKSPAELGKAYQVLKREGVSFRLGSGYLQDGLLGFDFIFRSPGVKLSLPEIVEAKKAGIPVSSATKLFFDLCPGRIIGVTGTKGKGTTATLISHILKEAGKDVYLAGNIGQPMLALLPQLKPTSWVVLELSSFQLIDLEKSPRLAVVLFITSEHLDWHKDKEEYIRAKSNIVRHQKKADFAVLNADNENSSSFASLTKARVSYFSRQKKVDGCYVEERKIFLADQLVGETSDLQLRGEHNWENVCAAVLASSLAGADLGSIKKTVFSFSGLEHRLELVGEAKGVRYYNDSFSTTPETAIAAIRSFQEPVVLIAGGSEKGSDYTELGKEISRSSVKTLILIGEMAERIKEACQKAGFKGKWVADLKNMEEIVDSASQEVGEGGVVLLSPACASFDMFENYKDRGRQFKEHVQALF